MKPIKTLSLVVFALAALATTTANAQTITSVQAAKDWTVYADKNNPKHCYVSSQPTSSKAFRDGQAVEANRGDIQLFVGIKNGAPEPSFLAGYPLKSDKAVEAKIGSKVFNFFTNPNVNPEYAWPMPNNDASLIASMKAGSAVEVTGMSQRGTTTVDTFSLSGFTAAYNAAIERCK